jgi:hypothetical protein
MGKYKQPKKDQERDVFERALAKRMAEFMRFTAPAYPHRQSRKHSAYARWKESSPKKELRTFLDANQPAELSRDLLGGYPKEQSCIEKLLLVCFCLRLPARKTFAILAPLLSKRISATTIVHVATNLNRKVASYHHSRPSKLSALVGSVLPTTLCELEKEADLLLASLRTAEPDLWNQLETAGLVSEMKRPATRANATSSKIS